MRKMSVVLMICAAFGLVLLGGCATKGDLQQQKQVLSADIAEVRSELVENRGAMAEISSNLEKIQAELKTVRKGLAMAKTVPALKEQTDRNRTAIGGLEDRLNSTDGSMVKMNQAIASVENDLQDRAESLQEKTATLTKQDQQFVKQIARINEVSEELIAETKTIKVFASKLDNDMQSLSDAVDDKLSGQKQKMMRDRQALSGILQSEYDTLELRMKQLKEAIHALSYENASNETAKAPSDDK